MIEHSKNQNVVAANLQQNQYGLLEISFVCEGMPEYPTALRGGKSSKGEPWTIYDDPLSAFRNGASAPKYPPQYSYHRSNRQIPSWTCKSVLFGDGSAYVASEPAREIADADRRRVFAASLSDWNYGLKVVQFEGVGLIGGKPIYPTALKTGKSLYELASDAFWGGAATANIPFEVRKSDDVLGAVWSAKSIVFRDGSAYAKEEEARALAEKDKMRIFAAELADWNYGLKVVRFDGVGLIGGKPIFPTALKSGKALTDKPLEAFWGGSATVNMPYETVLKDDNAGAVWSAKSIVFRDGSAYLKDDDGGNAARSKMRIFSARVFDAELGLKCVEFRGVGLGAGKPVFPTSLATGRSLFDNPRDAFFGGWNTVNLPWSADYTDDNAGVVWTARSYVKADGSPIGYDEAVVLREFFDIVDFRWAGCLNVDYEGGAVEVVGAVRKYRAKITEKLVSASMLNSALVVPFHVKNWAFFRAGGYDKDKKKFVVDSKSVSGALAGAISGIGGTYKGINITNSVGVLQSNPVYSYVPKTGEPASYKGYVQKMADGQTIECSVRRAFTDVGGIDWYVVKTVFLKTSSDGLVSGDYGA